MTRRWAAIVNPASGAARPSSAVRSLTTALEAVAGQVCVTARTGQAAEFTKQCADADGVIVAGGDGTLFEVLQELPRHRQAVAVLPTGRGNSLARDLGVTSVGSGLRAVTHGTEACIDLLEVSLEFASGARWQGWSASNVAIGYAAEVVRRAARSFSWAGNQCYALAGAVTRPRPVTARIAYDGGAPRTLQTTGIIITNTRHVGPYQACPWASFTDGRLETLELHADWGTQLVHNLIVLSRGHPSQPVAPVCANAVRVEVEEPTHVKVDGEVWPGLVDMTVCVIPGSLTCRVPGSPHA